MDFTGMNQLAISNTPLDNLTLPEFDALFIHPERIHCESAWFGHIPFAHWLVSAARPRLLVELGAHAGVSYAAFCRAVEAKGLDTRCFAVDTWRGDDHAGHYSEAVFTDLDNYNRTRFSAFSQLIRCTFDEASTMFADGSIDLLHIDGLHTYEAVKHDFETWRPKLSDRAVVLFHDTNERQRDFGVWRCWAELSRQWPAFEFSHGHGLGVLCIGVNAPTAIRELCALEESAAIKVRTRFAWIGERWEAEAKTNAANQQIEVRDKQIAGLAHDLLKQSSLTTTTLRRELESEKRSDISADQLRLRNAALRAEHVVEINQLLRESADRENQLRTDLAAVLNSSAWRATWPFRFLCDKIPPAARWHIRRGMKAAWWMATPWRLPRRLNALRGRRALQLTVAKSAPPLAEPPPPGDISYADWSSRFDSPGSDALARIVGNADKHATLPIIIRFDTVSITYAPGTIAALKRLIGVRWSAIMVFDRTCSSNQITLAKQSAAQTPEIAFSSAQFPATPGAPILFIEGGAMPRPHGPWAFVEALACQRGKLAYADEDFLDRSGSLTDPWFKPNTSRLLLQQDVLLGRMVAILPEWDDMDIVNRLLDPEDDGRTVMRRYALGLPAGAIVHIPHVLFHNNTPLPSALPLVTGGFSPDATPLVSIIIPTRDRWDMLGPCLSSISDSNWPKEMLEIIVVDNGSSDATTLDALKAAELAGDVRVIRDEEPFNYARLINTGANVAHGDVLLMLNNDTEVLDANWIRKLVHYAVQPDVGVVGAKLLYPDRTIQHGGFVCGFQGAGGHTHVNLQETEGGYFNIGVLTHETLAVTGACMAVRRPVFERVGGLDEAFRVSFNDTVFCLDLHKLGLRNIFLADPLLIHHESKSRGFDDTPEKIAVALLEARLAWARHPDLIRNDPSYSPCLSLENLYSLAIPPRRRAIWSLRPASSLKIMMLSITHAHGHDVAVVLHQQINALIAAGHRVVVAGPITSDDYTYPACERIDVRDPRSAAVQAVEHEVNLIIAHTQPFFSVVRWIGSYAPVIAYDHGEPPPHLFPDTVGRMEQLAEKAQCLAMSTRVLAVSDAVAAESPAPVHAILPLGNAHLGQWDDAAVNLRKSVRAAHGWNDRYVVLNVSEFHVGERLYKGLDFYIETMRALHSQAPSVYARAIFVLCGKGSTEDVAAMTSCGLTVYANVSDDEMSEMYAAADAYANFSRWEGYNLGIGQALAMGLPVVASDIPAHRAFGVPLATRPSDAAHILADIASKPPERISKIWDWAPSVAMLISEVESLCLGAPTEAAMEPDTVVANN